MVITWFAGTGTLCTPGEALKLLEPLRITSDKTLRRWADKGALSVVRTPGGHRRYYRSEIEGILNAEPRSETERQ